MSDKKITQLTQVTDLTGAELLPLAQGGVTKSASVDQLRGYKVYTALLTQSGGDVPSITVGDESLALGVSYTITANPDNYDLTPYGAPNSNVGTSFVSTSDGAPLPYTASLELSYNQGAPVVTVLENTIGNIWFTYDTDGFYYSNSNGLFVANKTAVFIGTLSGNILSGYRVNNNLVEIVTYNVSSLANENDKLQNTPIEIRVYN